MTLVCDYCAVYIEERNTRWPGFCSSRCRDDDRRRRDQAASDLAQHRAAARQNPPHHLT